MKYDNGIFLSLFLILIIDTVKAVKKGSNFSEALETLVAENKKQYSNLQKVIDILDMKPENTNLIAQREKVDITLVETGEIYKELGHAVGNLCFYNDVDRDRSLLNPNLDEKSPKFDEESKWLIPHQVDYLKNVIKYILSNTDAAQEYSDQIIEKLTSLCGVLVHIQESLQFLGFRRLEDLNTGNIKHIKRSKEGDGQVTTITEEFIENSKDYVLWLEQNLLNLKRFAIAPLKFVHRFRRIAIVGKDVLRVVENLKSNNKLEKVSKEEVVEVSYAMASVVQKLSHACFG